MRNTCSSWLLIATMGVAGLGIDLSAAATAIFVNIDPVPGTLLQCEDRLWRPPQQTAVLVYYIALRGTIDEQIANSVVSKLDACLAILGQDGQASGLQDTLGQVSMLHDVAAAIAALSSLLDELGG